MRTGTAEEKPSKYRNRKTEYLGIQFDSRKEADRYQELLLLERAGLIQDLSLQPRYDLSVNGHKLGYYKGDFRYKDVATDTVVLEDVKSPVTRTAVYQLKKKLVRALYECCDYRSLETVIHRMKNEENEQPGGQEGTLIHIIYAPKAFGALIGRTTNTLQKWDREGKLRAHRSPISNRRFYTHDQYVEYLGKKAELQGLRVAYARVSTAAQKPDLDNQVRALKRHEQDQQIGIDLWMHDIGSGLNDKRRHLNRLLDLVERGKVALILIAHRDRLVRFGFEWFETFCERHGAKILIMSGQAQSPEKEMVEDLLAIVTVFSARFHGLRSYRKVVAEKLAKETDQSRKTSEEPNQEERQNPSDRKAES
jgi:putative resolvase